MNIDSVKNGVVIDHIQAGKSEDIINYLNINNLDCSIAVIKNARSNKMGKKDIIKIEDNLDLNLDVLGFIDPGISINIIENDSVVEKKKLKLPEQVTGVIKCKNPRCITSIEQFIKHIFKLTDDKLGTYRCFYCENEFINN